MTLLKRKLLLLSALFLSSIAMGADGGLYAEPGMTYETTDSTINWPSPFSNSTGTTKGVGLMGRLGFHASETIFLALDVRYSKPTYKDSSTNVDVSSISTNYGPVLGIQVPVTGLRVWGQYIMDGTLDPDSANGFDYLFNKANGYRVGVGFNFILLSLNLEYQALKYRTTVQQGAGFPINSSFSDSDLTNKGYILSVSVPLEL